MKIITVPDVHGKTNWLELIGNPDDYDLIIFLGDYVDYKEKYIHWEKMYINLINIINLQKKYPEKIIMLVGNHDIPYIFYTKYPCGDFNKHALIKYQEAFKEAKLQVSYQIENIIWTHGGISNSWILLNKTKEEFEKHTEGNMSDKMNSMFLTNTGRDVLFAHGMDRGGYSPYGGIVWSDIKETEKDMLLSYHQIVGHNVVDQIITINKNDDTSITYTDTMLKTIYITEI